MDLGLQGRRAAVAAASQGLGFEAARALAEEGVRVAVCGRDRVRIEEAASRIGAAAIPMVADVSGAEGGMAFVAAAREALGAVDILVTNAGGPPGGDFASTPIERYPDALDLNLMSVVGMCTEAAPPMREQGWGRIIAITSLSARQPMPDLILSNTARAGATAFLKTLAREVAPDGVTVNSVQPGVHATGRSRSIYANIDEVAGTIPAGQLGRPEDFGAVCAFLCSSQARFITGAAIPVDGGAYAGLQ